MLIKAGVDISRLNREIRRALPKIQRLLNEFKQELIITSTYEGTHGEGSLHYGNDAMDIRVDHPNSMEIKEGVKEKLGKDYDVVYEGTHLHVEWDPKK